MTEPTSDTPDQQPAKHGPGVGQPRGQHGRFDTNPANAPRDAEAARLRAEGQTYRQIAEQLGVNVQTAHAAVKRAYAAVVQDAAMEGLAIELDRLDAAHARVMLILGTRYEKLLGSGENAYAVQDDGPWLAALGQLVRISESRRKLLGLDQPAKVKVENTMTVYQVEGVDMDKL